MSTQPIPRATLSPGDRLHGFVVDRVTPVEEIRALACRLEHEKSGGRVLGHNAEVPGGPFQIVDMLESVRA